MSLSNDLASAVADAQFVQESLPEDLQIKIEILTFVLELTPASTPVARSRFSTTFIDACAKT